MSYEHRFANGTAIQITAEMPARYDSVFKAIVGSDWPDDRSGNVESPSGYFALLYIPEDDEPEHDTFKTELPIWDSNCPHAGWYITTEDGCGTIWAYSMPEEWEARRAFDALEADYDAWMADDTEQ